MLIETKHLCTAKKKNSRSTQDVSFLRLLLAISLGLFLFACSGQKPEKYEERSVDSIYNEAMDSVLAGNYLTAAKQFFEVERQHPYSAWAAKAQIMGAYSYFRLDQYDDSINAADRFIQLHPSNADAPYAYYLRSLAYYEQIVDVARDQSLTQQALQALEDVIRRYPDTKYARDAALKLDLTRDHLAGKEMSVGRFYLEKGELAAAINRFKTVVEQYQTTSHVPEALLRMAECYSALGVKTEAKRVVAILGHNFPGSTWYTDAYNLLATLDSESGGATDERPFYKRWLKPQSKIPKAERRELKPLLQIDSESNKTDAQPDLSLTLRTSSSPQDSNLSRLGELTKAERVEFVKKARKQESLARKEADEWRKAAEEAKSPGGRRRANANIKLAEMLAEVWDARAQLGDAQTQDEKRKAEIFYAEKSVAYWEAVLEASEDDLARDHAQQALKEAQKLLNQWKENGSGPNWLERMIRSLS